MKILVSTRDEVGRFATSGKAACISINDSNQAPALLPASIDDAHVLRLQFDDVDGSNETWHNRPVVMFNESLAESILDFWHQVKDQIDVLLVHCNAGMCRSPAVAAVIEHIHTGEDQHWFDRKRPNMMVYRTLLETWLERTDYETKPYVPFQINPQVLKL
jgi:predicted protein tyrosine phosphatase